MISLRHLPKLVVLVASLTVLPFTSASAKRSIQPMPSQAHMFPDSTYLAGNMRISKHTGLAVAIYGVNSRQYSGTKEQIARKYLLDNKILLGMLDNLADLELIEVNKSPAGHHVGFRQLYHSIPVWRSEMVISINKENRVVMVVNHHKLGISISTTPTLSKAQGLELAKRAVDVQKEEFLYPPTAELIIYRDNDHEFHLSWHAII